MSLEACAELVRRGDPDRFLATMAAAPEDRARLWPIYAFNLEIARAPWASAEPLVAQMRLQFWQDVLEDVSAGRPPRAHEVAQPLAALLEGGTVAVSPLRAMVEARHREALRERFADAGALHRFLDDSAGGLMWAAAQALGAPASAEGAVRDAGFAAGVANWLVALPVIEARGWRPMPAPDDDAVLAGLAREGLMRLARARAGRGLLPRRAVPALLAGWRSEARLRAALRAPERVRAGDLGQSEFGRRWSLLWRSLTGWW